MQPIMFHTSILTKMLKKLLLFVFLITCFSGYSQFNSPTYKKGIMDTLWLKQANNKIWRLKVLHDTVLINNDTLIMGGIIMHDTTSFWQRNYGVISPTNASDTVQSNTYEFSLNPYDSRRYVIYGGQASGGINLMSGEPNSSISIKDSTYGIFDIKSQMNNGNYTQIAGSSSPTGNPVLGSIYFIVKDGAITNYLIFDKHGLHPASGLPFNLGQGVNYGYGNAPWDTIFGNKVKADKFIGGLVIGVTTSGYAISGTATTGVGVHGVATSGGSAGV